MSSLFKFYFLFQDEESIAFQTSLTHPQRVIHVHTLCLSQTHIFFPAQPITHAVWFLNEGLVRSDPSSSCSPPGWGTCGERHPSLAARWSSQTDSLLLQGKCAVLVTCWTQKFIYKACDHQNTSPALGTWRSILTSKSWTLNKSSERSVVGFGTSLSLGFACPYKENKAKQNVNMSESGISFQKIKTYNHNQ